MISAAAERLIIVAPGLPRAVASALAVRIEADGGPAELSVTLDVDPEVCRLGYGDIEALELLRPALASRTRNLQTQKGIRIGLVVADSDVLVYSPTPRLIEAGSNSDEKPNAIRIAGRGPEELSFVCGGTDEQILGLGQEVGLTEASEEAVEETKLDLKQNPPREFNLSRLERVFNYSLEFVEFSVEKFRLGARSVSLDPKLLGLADEDLKARLRNTFRVFEAGVPFTFEIPDPANPQTKVKVTEKWLGDEATKLRKSYFIPLGSGSYGNLILKRRKAEFVRKVNRLRHLVECYAEQVRESIEKEIKGTRDSLVKALYPIVKQSPPADWSENSFMGELSDKEIKQRLEKEVDGTFRRVEESFAPTVSCLFKGVIYETIKADTHFRRQVEKYFGKETAEKLLTEDDASLAKEILQQ
jgi:hypothetical protein